ncbi:MAG: DUF945 family protein [Arenicella sp.]|nr:DUF945 family protein [Arenicella sp.]
MKKLIIALGLLIAVLFFGAPYYTGKVAETETMKLVDKINASSAEYGLTEVLSYDRGIRSTSARYKYTPPISFADFANEFGDIIYRCDSDHGITGIDYSCALEGESSYSKFVAEHLDGIDPISVFGSISIFGSITQSISLDQVKGIEIDGASLNLPEALVSISTDAKTSKFYISGNSDAFEMEGKGEKFSVGKMTLEADFARVVGSFFTGEMLIKLEHFTSNDALGETSVKGLSVLSSASDQGDTLSSKVLLSADQVIAPGSLFESIKDIDISLDFIGLDKQSVIEYQEFTERLQHDNLTALKNPNESQTDPMQMTQLMPILEGMLKPGLEINANLSAEFDNKPSKIGFDLKLLDSLTIEQLSLFMSNPDDALKKIHLLLNASFDKGLIDSQPMVAAFIAHSPLIAAGNDNYALDLELGRKIELNGKAMSFAELQTLVLASLPL